MDIRENALIHGFRAVRIRESKELRGRLVEFRHEKTGGEVVWTDNGEENKLFGITFRTLPKDDTGVFHILEHSVLCGSDKYPVKEPFVELLKGSMNTFLNALTASDWTSYPVSSRNEKDFLNLTGVYLDAVFAPRILHDRRIFLQEGFHVETDGGTPRFNGVVYNEMKGAMSDIDRIADDELMTMLFPDTCYGFNSGGDPVHIPELTYEAYLDMYRIHYHPSNARVYLDGSVPLDKTLEAIDGYFSRYERLDRVPGIARQERVSDRSVRYFDPGTAEGIEKKNSLMYARILGDYTDRLESVMMAAIISATAGSNESPLKKAMLEGDLVGNIDISYDDSIYQHYVTVAMREVHAERLREAQERFAQTARRIYAEKISREDLAAAIDRQEFAMREHSEPAGLIRMFGALSTWLYGGDPLDGMLFDELFAQARAKLDTDAYEELFREAFIEEDGRCVLEMRPDTSALERAEREERERVESVVGGWSDKEKAANEEMIRALKEWHETPDSEEDIAKLPSLSLSDISESVREVGTERTAVAGVPVIFHSQPCRGIAYIDLYFSLADMEPDRIVRISQCAQLFSALETDEHSAKEIERVTKSLFGRLTLEVRPFGIKGEKDRAGIYLIVRCAALERNLLKAFGLLNEILTRTRFGDREKIVSLIRQTDIALRQKSAAMGHLYAMRAALAGTGGAAALQEKLTGASGAVSMHALAADEHGEIDDLIRTCETVRDEVFSRGRLTACVTAETMPDIEPLISGFPEGEKAPENAVFKTDIPIRTLYRIPAQVGYSSQALRLSDVGMSCDGSAKVLANILTFSFLWNEVRVKNGAYGTSLSATSAGTVYTYSYRDPAPYASLDVNRELRKAITDFCKGNESLDKYVISTVAGEDPLLSPADRGRRADGDILCGYTPQDREKERKEIISCTKEGLLSSCAFLDEFAERGSVCVVTGIEDAEKEKGFEIREL